MTLTAVPCAISRHNNNLCRTCSLYPSDLLPSFSVGLRMQYISAKSLRPTWHNASYKTLNVADEASRLFHAHNMRYDLSSTLFSLMSNLSTSSWSKPRRFVRAFHFPASFFDNLSKSSSRTSSSLISLKRSKQKTTLTWTEINFFLCKLRIKLVRIFCFLYEGRQFM